MDKNKVIESASKLISKGQFDKAVKEYQRVLEVDPDDVRVLQKLAELYQKMNRKAEAADCFEKVAKTYSAQGFYLKAVALYKQVLKVIDRVEVNVRLAELYQQLGLVGDATKEWQTVAAYYDKIGDTKQSLETLRKLVELDPDNVAARIRLGEQFARQDQLVEAVAELRRAAQYLQRNGRQDDYMKVAERISHLDQSDVGLAKELAESYLSRGDSKRALAKLQICFKSNPRDLGTLQMLARAFQELGQVSKTISVLKELARVHVDSGRGADARKVYQQALELAPDDTEVKAGLKTLGEEAPAPTPARPPAPAPKPPAATAVPAAPARPPTAPVQPARQPTAPVPARPPTSPIPASGGASTGGVPKLLKETEVYIKYGLHEKALEHLRKIFAVEPDNLEAHDKVKTVALASNRPKDAVASLATLVKLYAELGDPRAAAARDELRALDPTHAALDLSGQAPQAEEVAGDEHLEVEPIATAVEEIVESEEIVEEESLGLADDEDATAVDEHPVAAAAPEPEAESEDDEFASDIAEADFYIQAGLVEDARALLEAITMGAPDHAGANRRLREIGGPKKRATPAQEPARDHEDLAAELAAELVAEVGGSITEDDKPLDADVLDPFQVPAHEVLGEFRAKVRQTVRPEDVQTHYDLGIAYKEMGLLAEAIAEFELGVRHGKGARGADCYAMLGLCEMERGNPADAIERYRKGLALPGLAAEVQRALHFELGVAHEALHQDAEALELFQGVGNEEPGFRDVAARVQRLGGSLAEQVAANGAKPAVPSKSAPPGAATAPVTMRPAASAPPAPGGKAPVSSAPPVATATATGSPTEPEPPGAPRKNRKIGFV